MIKKATLAILSLSLMSDVAFADGISLPGVTIDEHGISAPGVVVGNKGIEAPGVTVGNKEITASGVVVGNQGIRAPGVRIRPGDHGRRSHIYIRTR